MGPNLDREMGSPVVFISCVGAIQILGILAMVLTGIWMGKYQGGFAWDGSGREFNYHPLCMVISMIFLYSEGTFLNNSLWFDNMGAVRLPVSSRHFSLINPALEILIHHKSDRAQRSQVCPQFKTSTTLEAIL